MTSRMDAIGGAHAVACHTATLLGTALLGTALLGCSSTAAAPPAPAQLAPAQTASVAAAPVQPAPEEAPPEPTPEAPSATAGARFEGSVGEASFAPRSALFLWRPGADDMQLFFSDSAELCDRVSDGTWPSGAKVLSITLKLNEDRDGPFRAGDYPVRGSGSRAARDTKRAMFLQLDAGCRPSTRSDASKGKVRLTEGPVSAGGTTKGEIDLVFADGALRGSFVASYCTPPEMELRGCK